MLHAGEAATVADRLIERVGSGVGAELLAIPAAEALDRVLVEQRLRSGEEREAIDTAGSTLVLRIEGADALDLVAEEVEAERLVGARRKEIYQAATDRKLA